MLFHLLFHLQKFSDEARGVEEYAVQVFEVVWTKPPAAYCHKDKGDGGGP